MHIFYLEPRGTGPSYWGGILTSVCCALFGWASAYNRHFLNKMPTIAVQGRPGIGKTNGDLIVCSKVVGMKLGIIVVR